MLDNAGGPSGVQVKNPFVIYAKMERNKKQKTSFRADFFFEHQGHFYFHYTEHRKRVSLSSVQETDLQVSDFCEGLYSDVQESLNTNKNSSSKIMENSWGKKICCLGFLFVLLSVRCAHEISEVIMTPLNYIQGHGLLSAEHWMSL